MCINLELVREGVRGRDLGTCRLATTEDRQAILNSDILYDALVDHFLVRVPKRYNILSCTLTRSEGVASAGVEVATRGAYTGSGQPVGNRTSSFAPVSALLCAIHASLWRAVDPTIL